MDRFGINTASFSNTRIDAPLTAAHRHLRQSLRFRAGPTSVEHDINRGLF